VVGNLVLLLARSLKALADLFERLSHVANGLLPALLPPAQLTALIREQYVTIYSPSLLLSLDIENYRLLPWETEVLNRYGISSGLMLILGSGCGREAIVLARKGLTVVGMDTNHPVLCKSQEFANTLGLPARFHQADFLHLPYAPASFDYVWLGSTMYSSVPGSTRRQAWLADLCRLVMPNGLVILSFSPAETPVSRRASFCARVNKWLVTLPGANKSYEPGDDCSQGHFLHAFQTEDEVRRELSGAGAVIRELNWAEGFALLTNRVSHG
jgi:2-polyprenyl-3-methyl-5-hydroxy-6-metoxy-1,4-benzoquinol methylase